MHRRAFVQVFTLIEGEATFVDLTDAPTKPTLSLALMLGELGVGKIGNLNDLTTPIVGAYKMTAPDMDLNDQYDARPAARHSERVNLAFMDGHQKALRLEQFYTGQMPPEKLFTP